MFSGGIADKRGNEYERKWTVRQLLEVIAGRATSMRYEGPPADFHGFEFALYRSDRSEWHQTKRNAPHGNWTLNALDREGLIDAFKGRLSTDPTAICVFVSQDPAKQMRELCRNAHITNDVHEFLNGISDKDRETFDELKKNWTTDERQVFAWLRRCEFRTESEQTMDETIAMYGSHLLRGDADLYASLSNYLFTNLNTLITTEAVREWIREGSPFTFRPATLDPTLREAITAANRRYLESYTPFGFGAARQRIDRVEAEAVVEHLQAADGPTLILLTGKAGSGKSGVVRAVMDGLETQAIPHLAFRTDRYLSCRTRNDMGSVLLNRDESPVSALANLAQDGRAVLIIDQLDAVSETSGRTGAVKDTLFELVRETHHYEDVRCLLVCRDFDLENDPQYRGQEQERKAVRVQVQPLSWEHEVMPVLEQAGVVAERLTARQRDLLALPLNLTVFLEINDPTFSFTTGTALMQKLFEKKAYALRRDRQVGWSVQAPLSAMAEWMSDQQELSCPDYVLGQFDGAKDWLASEGLIVVGQNRLAFFHESFFDFIFARTFVQSQRDISDFLTVTEQHLFRRTQIRQILALMRDTDRPRYLETLKTVLTHPQVRFHIKHAVAQWLASLDNATQGELTVILRLDDDGAEFPVLMRRALFGSESWFDLLNASDELSRMLTTGMEPRRQALLRWMCDILDKRPRPVAALLRAWWAGDSGRTDQLVRWFGSVRQMPMEHTLTALLHEVIRSAPAELFSEDKWKRIVRLLPSLSEAAPEITSTILRTLLAQWFAHYPGTHLFTHSGTREIDISYLVSLADQAPTVFLDGMIPALVESVRIALNMRSSGDSLYVLYKTNIERGPSALFSLYRDALRALAETSPPEAESRLDQLDPTLHKVLLHLHLETIRVNPTALGHRFATLLDARYLFSAGLEEAEWKSFADAARGVVEAQCLPVQTIEDKVFRHHPEQKQARELLSLYDIEEQGETRARILAVLERSGHIEWCVLKTIGHDLLSSRGKKRLAELERKFADKELPTPRVYQATFVDSPIPSNVTCKMTDEQWLSAINTYQADHGLPQIRRGRRVGGALELARELEGLAKSDPGRFARLFLRLPESVDPVYGQFILQGLAAAEQVDEAATIAALRAAHAHQKRPFGLQIVSLVKRHPGCAQDDDIFRALLWYAEHGEAGGTLKTRHDERSEDFPSIDDLIHTKTSLVNCGINAARGATWEVLGQLVQSQPHRTTAIWTLVEDRVGKEPSAPVRATMLYALVPFFSLDPHRFGTCLRRLVASIPDERDDVAALDPLVTHIGVHLLPYIERDLPGLALELMGRMIDSSDRQVHLIGTWWVLAERLRQGNLTTRFPDIQWQSPAHAKLWASILCEFVAHTEFRAIATSELRGLFSYKAVEVRRTAADVFWHIPKDDFPHFMDMAWAFVRSPAFKDAPYPIINVLEKTSHDVTELVVEAGEILVQDRDSHGGTSVYEIQKILEREYMNSEKRPEIRARVLDLIDFIAAKNFPEAAELMALDDR